MRRRIFWSMLAVATVALFIAAAIAALIGQNIVGGQTRSEMSRQAQAVEGLLGERLSEDNDSARVLGQVLEGVRRVPAFQEAPRARGLFQTIEAARRLFGSPLVDLAFIDSDGTVSFLTPTTTEALAGLLDVERLRAGEGQFVTVSAEDSGGNLPFLVHARPVQIDGLDGASVQMAVVVGRRTAVIELDQVARGMVLAFAVAVLLSAVFSRLLARRVTRRLDGLADAAAALATGDVSARAPVRGTDEVADVARAFNDMAAQLEDLSVREREFLLSVGHDLRTPLTTIAGYAEVLEEGSLDDAETHRIAGVLAVETARLRRLVEDLMLLARLEAREFTLDIEPVDVGAHTRELVDGFRPRAEALRVRLESDIEPTGLVETDADRLGQIVGNLMENALRYSPEAGAVTVRVRRVAEEVELAVADTGSGIDAADLPRVFDKFYVARRYRRLRPEGSGLGLSIVKELVDAMGGRVAVTSDPNEGTTVWVRLPAGHREVAAAES